jgi:hypothetical protein
MNGVEADSLALAQGHIAALRQDVGELVGPLEDIQTAAALGQDGGGAGGALDGALNRARRLFEHYAISKKAEKLGVDLESDAPFAAAHAGELTRIINLLYRIEERWPPASVDPTATIEVASTLETISELNYATVEFCAITEVNAALAGIRSGKSLGLDAQFSALLSSSSDRDRLFAYLERSEQRIEGIIDAKSRLAYRTPPTPALRLLACVSPLLFFTIGGGLLLLVSRFDNWGFGPGAKWPLTHGSQLLGAYLLLAGGAVGHLLVENAKLLQSKQVPILAIGDLLTWLELRWAGLAWTFLIMVVSVIGLRYAGVSSNAREIPVWLASGYSLDSIAGLVLTRFDTAASANALVLRGKLDGSGQ